MNPASRTVFETPQSRCLFALAWADITPPAGIYHRMWGAAKHERATGVHRPLRATVAWFQALPSITSTADDTQIIVSLDHCVLGAQELQQLLQTCAVLTQLPEERFLVVFTHTHGAGLMSLDRVALPGGDLIAPYLEALGQQVVNLVLKCRAKAQPVTWVHGQGHCSLAAHRDYWDAARAEYVCGFNPGHPADDTLLVARAHNEAGQVVATLINYACHPTTLAWDNTQVSPDFVGELREVVERETNAPCLFLQGACGELGPREGFVGDPTIADRNGRELAFAALATLVPLPKPGTRFQYQGAVVSGATIGTWSHVPQTESDREAQSFWSVKRWTEPLAYRADQPSPAEVDRQLEEFNRKEQIAREQGDTALAADWRALAERQRRLRHRLAQLPPGNTYPLQVTAWRIGPAWWIGVQGESYSLLQTELRNRFPNQPIYIASIAADWGASYLPTRETYGKGIYQESIAVVAPGSLEQLIDSIARHLSQP
jgi:hypothetical protein